MNIIFHQSEGHGNLQLEIGPANKMESGDLFLWYSLVGQRYEIHKFHSDVGYGIKTFTDYNKETEGSLIVSRTGACGKINL